jgi:hypothetical protein
MAGRSRSNRAGVRGKPAKAQLSSELAEIVSDTARLWRKHHLGYDQTKYVVEQARRRLKLRPPGARRRTVNRLDKSEVERLIRNTYESHSKYGLMIKTLFLSGARVDEFVHNLSLLRQFVTSVRFLHESFSPFNTDLWSFSNLRPLLPQRFPARSGQRATIGFNSTSPYSQETRSV